MQCMLRGIVGRDVGAVVSGSPVPDCAAPLTPGCLESGPWHRAVCAPGTGCSTARRLRRKIQPGTPGVFLADLPSRTRQSASGVAPKMARSASTSSCASGAVGEAACRVAITSATTRSHTSDESPAAAKRKAAPLRALRLVVLRLQLVDRVMEPLARSRPRQGARSDAAQDADGPGTRAGAAESDSGDEARRSGPVVAPSSRMALRFPGSARREPKTPARPRCCRPRCSRLTRAQIRAGERRACRRARSAWQSSD